MASVTTCDPVAPALPPPPEGVLYEIVDGRYEELPEMSVQAGIVAARLSRRLGVFADDLQLGEVVTEVLFGLTPGSRRKHRPDVAFVSYKRWPKDRPSPTTDPWPVVPELAVEVISPNDLAESVQEKVQEYLAAGVQLVWLIYPRLAWVVAYESIHRMRGFAIADDLEAEPVLSGFRLPMRELFSGPAAPPANGAPAHESEPKD
jgi:Uma2 family endonuclease